MRGPRYLVNTAANPMGLLRRIRIHRSKDLEEREEPNFPSVRAERLSSTGARSSFSEDNLLFGVRELQPNLYLVNQLRPKQQVSFRLGYLG